MATKSPKKKKIHPLLLWMLSYVSSFWFWLVRVSSRWHHHNRDYRDRLIESGKPFIVGFWHGRIMMAAFLKQEYDGRFMMLSSNHRDADIIIHAVRRMGVEFVRGSSANPLKKHKKKSGASATLTLLKAIEEGVVIGMTPDGPRGPRQRLQPGIVQIAKLSGVPILPVGASTSRAKFFNSWDRFMLALPFAKVHFCYGKPIYVKGETEQELQHYRTELEAQLTELMAKADHLCGQPSPQPAAALVQRKARILPQEDLSEPEHNR